MTKSIRMKMSFQLGILISAAVLFSACAQPGSNTSNTVQKNDAAAVAPLESASPAPASRLPEILDGKKQDGRFCIYMFNVEKKNSSGRISTGDTLLLKSPDGVFMLMDAGYKESIPGILEHIKKLGVQKLDYILATHMHEDHVAGFPAVLNSLPVGKALMSKYTDFKFKDSPIFLNTLKEKNITTEFVKEGDTFQFGKEIKVEVLNPEDSDEVIFRDDHYSNQDLCNEQSVVLKMTYGNNSFLFTGDIQLGTESRLVEKYGDKINVDLLKVAHHGYGTSSGSEFLKTLSPSVSLIPNCVMPYIPVYEKCKQAGSKVYVNGMDGIVLAVSDGKSINIITEKERNAGAYPP